MGKGITASFLQLQQVMPMEGKSESTGEGTAAGTLKTRIPGKEQKHTSKGHFQMTDPYDSEDNSVRHSSTTATPLVLGKAVALCVKSRTEFSIF